MPPKRKNMSADTEEKQVKAKTIKKSDPKSRLETESSNKLKSELETGSVQESNVTCGDGGGGGSSGGDQMDVDESAIGSQALVPAVSSDFVDHFVALAKQELLSRQVVDLTTASPVKEPGTSPSQDSPDLTRKSAATSNAPVRTSQRLSSKVIPSSKPTAISSSEPTSGQAHVTSASGQKTVAPLPLASGIQKNTAPPLPSSQKCPPRNLHFYNSKPRTNAKGNIVYERMPSGEVIASLIRKPEVVQPGKVHQGNAGGNLSNRHAQISFQGSQPTALSTLGLEHCPFNEYNIGEVLEKSIKATGSMRMLLTSLKDDLQRIGSTPMMVSEEQARKRQDVADKLTKAYTTFRHSVEDVDPVTLLKSSGATGQNAAVIRGHAQKLSEAARPVMLVRNDAAVRLTMQSERQKNDAADCGKFWSREVIELSESEDENVPDNSTVQEELDSGDKVVKRDRPI